MGDGSESSAAAPEEQHQKLAETFAQVMDGIQAAAGIVADESGLGDMVREAFDGVLNDITTRVDLEQRETAAASMNHDSASTAEASESSNQDGSGVSAEPVLHPNVICDGCNCAIVGTRFKSLTHPDFDLCATCEAAGLHPEHIMIRIRTPSQKASWLAHKLQHVVAKCQADPVRRGCAMQPPFWAAFVPPGAFPHHGPPHGHGWHGHHGPKHRHHRGGGRRHGPGRQHQHYAEDRNVTQIGDRLPTGRLKRGSHGPGVAQLQHFLIKSGLMDPSAIRWRDGLYGPRTAAAVQAFQEANRLEGEHGVFDQVVRAALLAGWPAENIAGTPAPDVSAPAPPPVPTTTPDNDRHYAPHASAPVLSAPVAEPVFESPVPSTTPPAAEQPAKWAKQLETLAGMGFVDIEANTELLEEHNGAVPFVVTELLPEL